MKSRFLFLLVVGTFLSTLVVSPHSSGAAAGPKTTVNAAAEAAPTTAASAVPLDTPENIVSGVAEYTLAAPKFFWLDVQTIDCDPDSNNHTMRDLLKRRAVQGSTIRTLYDRTFPSSPCSSQFMSNLAADSDNVYWTTAGALLRLSTNANVNPPTAPATVTASVSGDAELISLGNDLYALTPGNGIWKINKTTNAAQRIITAANAGASPHNFQTEGVYLYWMAGSALKRYNIASGGSIQQVGPSGVTGYFPKFYFCLGGNCPPSDGGVYIGVNKTLKRYNLSTGALIADLYTSVEATASIREIAVSAGNVFFVEDRETGPADPFTPINSTIFRKKADGSGSAATLYISSSSIGSGPVHDLLAYSEFVYWGENNLLRRLPQDASALPLTNLRISNIEVTQAIQDLSNGVLLVRGKRTFVRVHAKSDGPDVPYVTMLLYRLDPQGQPVGQPLQPSNKTGQYLTVKASPQRSVLEDTFWFELPIEWTQGVNGLPILNLRAELNPYHYPPQASYANNSKISSNVLSSSPTLELRFVLFSYDYANSGGGTNTAETRYWADYQQTLSWMRRAYPVASEPKLLGSNGPGLLTHYFYHHDNDLRSHLNYSSDDCPDKPSDDAGLCASDYVHGLLEEWDDEGQWTSAPMFGMMPQYTDMNGKTWFPRGSTDGDTSNGPSNFGAQSWDTDGSSTDWYTGHEIGHVFDRDHPTAAGDPDVSDSTRVGCGHSQDDDDYPYANAMIGNGSLMGFETGDSTFGIKPAAFPNSIWTDVMSYCNNQWISDYTYEGLYDEISLRNARQANRAQMDAQRPEVAVVHIAGTIFPDKGMGKITRVRRLDDVATAQVPSGPYRLRALGAGGAVLATHVFSPTSDSDGTSRLRFSEFIPWQSGMRSIELQNAAGTQTLAGYLVSANAPTISNVHLGAATSPVTGSAQLLWDASDADGDQLTFDIWYSKDNGLTFEPLELNVTAHSASVNTLLLGGSATAILRVTASDGAQTAEAATAPFSLANKPAIAAILSPASGARFAYGQTINFSAMVDDPQGSIIPDTSLTWSDQNGMLHKGSQFSASDLPVGVHTIEFSAINGAGLVTTQSITVEVHDDLGLPGATLVAGPSEIGWHFDAGATQSKTEIVYVSNAGGGTLNWTASESAPWLSLSATSGAAPGQITLTANPTGITADSLATTLTITTGSGANAQTVVIPVSLSIGNSHDGNELPQVAPPTFIPLIMK